MTENPRQTLNITVILGQAIFTGMPRPMLSFLNADGSDPEGVLFAIAELRLRLDKCEADMKEMLVKQHGVAGNA